MRTITLSFLFLTIGIARGTSLAQPRPAEPPLTVDQAVALAIGQNPGLSAAARDVGADRAGVRSARALANPELTFLPGLTGPGGTDQELLLAQPLELNGTRRARTGVASAQLRQTQANAVVELRNLVAATKTAYYELAKAQQLRALSGELLNVAQQFDQMTRRQVEVGTRPGIDRMQTGIQVARAQQQVTLADRDVSTAAAALNTLMGRHPAEPIGALPPLTFAGKTVDNAAVAQQALASRAEITAAEAARDLFREQARLARAQGRPDLSPQFRATSVTRGLHDFGLGIGVDLPLIDYGSRRSRIRQAEEAARAQSDRITQTRNTVRQEVEQALVRLRAAAAVVQSYQQGVLDQTRRLLDASQIGFQNGQTSILQVLEAQRTYFSVQSEYITALATHAQAAAELERAIGVIPAQQLPAAPPSVRK